MPIRPRGSGWQVDVKRNGRRLRKTVHGSREDAELAEAELRLALYGRDSSLTTQEHPTLQQALDETKVRWEGTKNERMALANAQAVLNHLGADRPVREIRTAEAKQLIKDLQAQGNSTSTINRKLSALSVLLRTAEDHEWIDRAPRIPRLKEPSHRVVCFSKDEEKKILEAVQDPHVRDLFVFLIDTGARLGEALSLRWSETVDRSVLFTDTKNGDDRMVPTTPRVWEILEKRSGGKGPFTDLQDYWIREQWELARKALGRLKDRDCVIHGLRHTFCSRLVQRGIPIQQVKELAGHRNIATTLRYAHLNQDNLRDAIAVLA